MDALQYVDLRASKLRIQIDGASDNVNFGLHCTAALLIHFGIFEQVYINRMPTGLVHDHRNCSIE
jgi:hypothetical protein